MTAQTHSQTRSYACFWLIFVTLVTLHVTLWSSTRHIKASWQNVPPVPTANGAAAIALGDKQFGYRVAGLTLQNLGNVGGQVQKFEAYDYDRLKDWFFMAHGLDSRSNFVPYLAAFYFSAVKDQDKTRELIDYLRVAGSDDVPGYKKWRWLAQAVYLARFEVKDLELAYELALELAASKDPSAPIWTKQMPAFVMTAKGDKQAAYDLLVEMLRSSADKLPQYEINAMRSYICDRVLEPETAKTDPLCEGITW